MVPTHFSSVLLSNWQSAVAKLARPAASAGDALARPGLDFTDARIAAAAAAADPDAGPLTDPAQQHAKAALDLATALVNGSQPEVAAAQQVFARYGNHDPFWSQCVLEFVEHYTLTKHASVPYVKYADLADFVLPEGALPDKATIGVVGDWGTGEDRAQRLLDAVARLAPDILIHLGDIYYSCTASEANSFYQNVMRAFAGKPPRVLTLCGNHDMYSGAAPYYALLNRIQQPASYFCLRNASWQILGADTGYNDFDPFSGGADAVGVRDTADGDDFSELAWHKDKLATAGGRRTILLTHHQPITRNGAITHKGPPARKQPVNDILMRQFGDVLPQIDLWLWGHEHNQLVYAPYAGLQRGRCLGASAIPVAASEDLTRPNPELAGASVPDLLGQPGAAALAPERGGALHQLGYAMLTLDGPALTARYFQFDGSNQASTLLYSEVL